MAKAKDIKTISDLKPQVRNSNKHTQRGLGLLQDSIQTNGWIGAITVAADGETFDGSARIEVGADAGFDDAIIVRSNGSKPIVHIREDIKNADDPKAKLLGVAANRIAEIDFDPDVEVLAGLADDGIEFGHLYSDDELSELLAGLETPTGDEDSAKEENIASQFLIIITCKNEMDQTKLLERFNDEGLQCKALLS